MTRLWENTVAEHKLAIREAILDAAGSLIERDGIVSLNMSSLAVTAGIGRATLYKYFEDIREVLESWHRRKVADHLRQLRDAAEAAATPLERLRAVLLGFAHLSHRGSGHQRAADFHGGAEVAAAEQEVTNLLEEIVSAGQRAGTFRADLAAEDLARFCFGAASAASRGGKGSGVAVIELALQAIVL
ncbi:MAG TPA: TetR/AcrR family transcriptional regulator [Devosia sp.]|jgi:AcrR family transcriptional regulator